MTQFKFNKPANNNHDKQSKISTLSNVDDKNIMTYGRFNRTVTKYNKFDIKPYPKAISPNRIQAVNVKDALVDAA